MKMGRLNALHKRLEAIQKDEGPTALKQAEELAAIEDPSDEEAQDLTAANLLLEELKAEQDSVKAKIAAEKRRHELAAAFEPVPPPAGATGLQVIATHDQDPTRFASFGEQLMAVYASSVPGAVADPRLHAAASGLQTSVGADGGVLVQTEFADELFRHAHETGLLASRCRPITAGANANRIKIPAVDETSRANGSRWGGVVVYMEGEAEQYTKSKPTFTKLELSLGKMTGLAYATDEMLEDHVAMESIINDAFAEEFGFKMDDQIFRGTGAGQWLGFMNAAAKVTVAKEGSQAAATIVANNVLKMFARMPARLRANAVWLINQDAEPQLPTMTIGDKPVYLPPTGLEGTGVGSLLGRPVIPVEHAETLGTEGDISFVNLGEYVIYEKGQMKTATSIHVRFEFGEQAFRFTMRNDGKPRWKSPLTPYKGAGALSPFVTLAARA